jgi:hypothetical protein
MDDGHLPYRLGQFTASACPPVIGFLVATRPHCKSINEFVFHYIEQQRPDTVVMLASWSFYAGGEFERLDIGEIDRTVERLRSAGVRQVFILGPLPRWTEHQPNVVLREWDRTHSIVSRTNTNFDPSVLAYDRSINNALAASRGSYLSPIGLLCDAGGCPVLTQREGRLFPMAWDDAHLTLEGSEDVARRLLPLMFR